MPNLMDTNNKPSQPETPPEPPAPHALTDAIEGYVAACLAHASLAHQRMPPADLAREQASAQEAMVTTKETLDTAVVQLARSARRIGV